MYTYMYSLYYLLDLLCDSLLCILSSTSEADTRIDSPLNKNASHILNVN